MNRRNIYYNPRRISVPNKYFVSSFQLLKFFVFQFEKSEKGIPSYWKSIRGVETCLYKCRRSNLYTSVELYRHSKCAKPTHSHPVRSPRVCNSPFPLDSQKSLSKNLSVPHFKPPTLFFFSTWGPNNRGECSNKRRECQMLSNGFRTLMHGQRSES